MNIIRPFLVGLLTMLLPLTGIAQAREYVVDRPILSLDDCINMALLNNEELRNVQKYVSITLSKYQGSKVAFLGNLDMKLSQDASNRIVSFYNSDRYYSAKFDLSQSLDWSIPKSIKKSELGYMLALCKSDIEQHNVAYAVHLGYCELSRLKESARYKQLTIERLKKHVGRMKILLSTGAITKADILKVELLIRQLMNDYQILNNDYLTEKAKLALVMNYDGSDFEIALYPKNAPSSTPSSDASNTTVDNPQIRESQFTYEIAETDTELLKLQNFPKLQVSGTYGYEGEKIDGLAESWGVSLNLDIPVFHWGSHHRAVRESLLAADILRIKSQLTRKQIAIELKGLLARASTLSERVNILDDEIGIREKELESLNLKYAYSIDDIQMKEIVECEMSIDEIRQKHEEILSQYIATVSAIRFHCGKIIKDSDN